MLFSDLQKQINESKIEEKACEEKERSLLFKRDHLDKLESELKKQTIRTEKKESEYQLIINYLKQERNKLEITVAELKKKLLTSPETVSEVIRLKEIVKSKDIEINRAREHYRELLKRMKSSLLNLEKRHRKTQEKLEASIIL
uniref:RAB6-interacting golgin n=1 Tax=Heterorhabditis bacteriophora TaxID=37862 RepID=A0A1I7WZ74_HETBA